MKVCIYGRVSSSGQDTENQVVVLANWADQRGYEVVRVYQESESAWKAGHQGELARLIVDAKKKISGSAGMGTGSPQPRRGLRRPRVEGPGGRGPARRLRNGRPLPDVPRARVAGGGLAGDASAGQRQQVEAAGEDDDAGEKQPAGGLEPLRLLRHRRRHPFRPHRRPLDKKGTFPIIFQFFYGRIRR